MKTIAILQPTYLPWLGYFEQMAVVDLFVHMDDVQYTRKDWRNRNRVRAAASWTWLTVPVKKCPRSTLLRDILVNYEHHWVKRHLKTIYLAYKRAPYFEPVYDQIKAILESHIAGLVELDVALVQCLRAHLGITTPESFSSSVPRESRGKNERIIEICKYFGADLLYDGKSAADFIDKSLFASHGIQVVFQDYRHHEYPQQFGEFISHMSALDAIINTGPDARSVLMANGDPLSNRRE